MKPFLQFIVLIALPLTSISQKITVVVSEKNIGTLECKCEKVSEPSWPDFYNTSCCFQNAEYQYAIDRACIVFMDSASVDSAEVKIKQALSYLGKNVNTEIKLGSASLHVRDFSNQIFLYSGAKRTMVSAKQFEKLIAWLRTVQFNN